MIDWFAVACELQVDWRNGAEALAALFGAHIPDYGNLMQSHEVAQRAVTQNASNSK